NNRFNFGVNATSLPNYINNIDISNTINGKPIHYWIKQNDQKVPSNIGYIALIDCANITIQNLEISKNYNGLLIAHSTNITLVNNIILENYEGIRIDHCLDCNLRENSMQNNIYNFGLTGRFSNSIDTSNTVNEKQLIYWINQHEKIVPNNSGLVILINCSGIIVQNLSLSNNGQGVFLYNTTNSMITQNTITYNNCVIEIFRSRNNTITKNFINNNINNGITIIVSKENDFYNNTIVSNKGDGIYLCASSNNQIRANNITNNACGIRFQNNTITNTTYNMVTENNIVRNGIFIFIQYQGAYNNTLYHDNFVNNTKQLFVSILIPGNSPMIVTGSGLTMLGITKNFWDNGSEGNYWSDYAGADTNQDGIGDTACRIRNTDYDYYPLMDPFN
ncbi:MAG: hypothetical protein GX638_02905, partial [Crenarchaeota archaeon]|nr:hypothetical protein [Thermoproteota archaeon]